MNVLIIGGNSGLGLEIGLLFQNTGATIYVTGQSNKTIPEEFIFYKLTITDDLDQLRKDLDSVVATLPTIDILIYAAGFLEKGKIAELSDEHICQMINVGLTTPALILQRIITKQGQLDGFVAITSTSQWIPRENEPVYSSIKAGLAMFAQSVSLDSMVKKTLVVGPAGMNTNFWSGSGRDSADLLSPQWVGEQIIKLWENTYVYCLARILRDPTPEAERVQIIEIR